MTIIKQTGVQSSGHMKNLRGYINDDRKVILRDSLNMDGCTNPKRWAHHMWMTREAYGHNKAARRVRDKKTGDEEGMVPDDATVAYISTLDRSREERAFELAKHDYYGFLDYKKDEGERVFHVVVWGNGVPFPVRNLHLEAGQKLSHCFRSVVCHSAFLSIGSRCLAPNNNLLRGRDAPVSARPFGER